MGTGWDDGNSVEGVNMHANVKYEFMGVCLTVSLYGISLVSVDVISLWVSSSIIRDGCDTNRYPSPCIQMEHNQKLQQSDVQTNPYETEGLIK